MTETIRSIIDHYYERFVDRHGANINADQWSALNAMRGCRTEQYGQVALACDRCDWQGEIFQSCGHRSCPHCQHDVASQWLERQTDKLLPVRYFMVTFTIPTELRDLFKTNQSVCYTLLFESTVETLKRFGLNDKALQGELGFTGVLHTHSRRLDYHPHIHYIVPAGSFNPKQNEWKEKTDRYLFKQSNLAKVFRATLLNKLKHTFSTMPKQSRKKWIVDCRDVGSGLPALKYLSRYLYRGVISSKSNLSDNGTEVNFDYEESRSKKKMRRALKGEDFILLLLQHVLPKGFRRVRDFGFLHGNAKKRLRRIQLYLKVSISLPQPTRKASKHGLRCAKCQATVSVVGFISALDYRKAHPT